MLALVVAHRHAGGVIGVDVGGHQVRIDVEPGGGGLPVAAGLVLELRHPVQPAEPGHAVEDPGQPRMRADRGLHEQDGACRIDAAGQHGGGHLQNLRAQNRRVLPGGDGVQVHHAIQALVILLQRHPLADGAQIVADGGNAGRLDAGEDALHGRVLPAATVPVKSSLERDE